MSGEIPQNRKELYVSALGFLKDPSVATAPLTQKIEFLQGKGLTEEEIQLALKEATGALPTQSSSSDSASNAASSSGSVEQNTDNIRYEAVPPAIPNRDWKDYFIMATASVGLFYGVYELTKRYIIPQLVPESKAKLEQDKELIMEQFDKVEKLLTQIEQEHDQFKTKEESKLQELDSTIVQLQTALEETTKIKQHIENEFSALKSEFTNMQNAIDSFTKDNESGKDISKINEELQSLKNLIKNTYSAASQSNSSPNGALAISPMATGPVPGADAIPSAADILANMEFGKKTSPKQTSPAADDLKVPAWKKAREENSSINSPASNIPEWQRAMNTGNSYESN